MQSSLIMANYSIRTDKGSVIPMQKIRGVLPYSKCKIYSDRSHYIAIPHTERPYKPRRKVQEEEIVVE